MVMGRANGFNPSLAMGNGMSGGGNNASMMGMGAGAGYNPSFAMANGMYGGSNMQSFGNPYAQGYAYNNGFNSGYAMGAMYGMNGGPAPFDQSGGYRNSQNGQNSSVLAASFSDDQAPRAKAKSKSKKAKSKVKRVKRRSS